MPMIGYKKIIENMVECEVENFIEKRNKSHYAYTVDGSLELSLEDKSLGLPSFTVDITFNNRLYTVSGYISEYGTVQVCSVHFERDYVKDPNRSDWYANDNIRHETEWLYGTRLYEFKFDR